MIRRIHVNKRWLSLRCLLSTRVELGKARTIALLGKPLVCQDTADIFVLHHEPCLAAVPELDLGYRIGFAQSGIFYWGLGPARAREGEFWNS